MEQITTLEYVLQADADNAIKSMANLTHFLPDVVTGIDSYVNAFEGVSREWGEVTGWDGHNKKVQAELGNLVAKGMAPKDAFEMLRTAGLVNPGRAGDTTAASQNSLYETDAILARAQLTNRLHRDFLFGVSDLLRLRATSAVGYVRVQCETAALISLMKKDPIVAKDWFDGMSREGGKQFYKNWGKSIAGEVGALGLRAYHEEGSNTALHSRIGGVVRGFLIGGKSRKPGEVKLAFQELDTPPLLLFALLPYLRFHCDVLALVEKLYPELDAARIAKIDRDACYSFRDQVIAKAREVHTKMGKEAILIDLGGGAAIAGP